MSETAPVGDGVDAVRLDDPARDDLGDLGGTVGPHDPAEMAAVVVILGGESETFFEPEAECGGRHRLVDE